MARQRRRIDSGTRVGPAEHTSNRKWLGPTLHDREVRHSCHPKAIIAAIAVLPKWINWTKVHSRIST